MMMMVVVLLLGRTQKKSSLFIVEIRAMTLNLGAKMEAKYKTDFSAENNPSPHQVSKCS